MSDISELDEQQLRKELSTLRIENKAAFATINKLLIDLNKKSEQIEHLQSLISQAVPVVTSPKKKNEAPAKDEIAFTQLERLRTIANQRILTLEETRMFDILVKSSQVGVKENKSGNASYRDVADIELLQIVQKEYPVRDDSND